jgi:hypothetical protein
MVRWGGLEGEVVNLLAPGRTLAMERGCLQLDPYEVMWLTTVDDEAAAAAGGG